MASKSAFDPNAMFRVDGIVAVITGGGSGRCDHLFRS